MPRVRDLPWMLQDNHRKHCASLAEKEKDVGKYWVKSWK
ncbi:rCG63122 [Rattus norvegicus]|uniref:RCG63122 n=1 Tax=Rattus norvegicus TaxID=10116 RepID=A6KKR0_RAT|nr:rCG63122 [Rattus norvegicus]